jgi:hypothetical protein
MLITFNMVNWFHVDIPEGYTGWKQNHSLISSSYKIKTYWNIYINKIFNFPARRQRAVKCKMALTSQQRSWCVLEFHITTWNQEVFLCSLCTQVGKASTPEHWHFPALKLRERTICIGYMFLISRRYCDQNPKLLPSTREYVWRRELEMSRRVWQNQCTGWRRIHVTPDV